MPAEGMPWLPRPELLTDAEVVRLVGVFVDLGIREVRFTGGEPLLRRGLTAIVAAVAALRPRPEISSTTDGIGLDRLAEPLCEAGLDRVDVSLDTLLPDTSRTITRRDRHSAVPDGLAAAVGLRR
jgi:cyclic pyranopterin phosphate synthase